jgi:hypothetical protein
MSVAPRRSFGGGVEMTEAEYVIAFKQVRACIAELPPEARKPLRTLFREVMRRHAAIRKDVNRAQDGLTELSIMLKYFVFDYEATLREQSR